MPLKMVYNLIYTFLFKSNEYLIGTIIPTPGRDVEYDRANQNLSDVEEELKNYLEKIKAQLK
jgi:hypothetical protein